MGAKVIVHFRFVVVLLFGVRVGHSRRGDFVKDKIVLRTGFFHIKT